ncbi:cyclase family protein [Mycobacterium sp. pUA109]|uniref:cyclase family protein n=1 Tax=Mycobacterium sp. pUA109 TaxID=3238982 RepID=UPI00351AEDF6
MANGGVPTNWGRWGDDDEMGTLHLIDAAARARAAAEVRSARHVSLARMVDPVPFAGGGPVGVGTAMPAAVLQAMNFTGVPPMAMTDTLVINTHNAALTHLDAVSHVPLGDKVYPGVPLGAAVTAGGVRHGSSNVFGAGILTRGVLLDLAPGGRLGPECRVQGADLDEAVQRADTDVHSGDAVVVRGGWDLNRPMGQPVPGLSLDAVGWLHDHGVSLYLGDIGDARPWAPPLPVHQVALARLGMPLVDLTAVDELADVCRDEQRHSFMLVLAPPRISGATGLPVNPIAIF